MRVIVKTRSRESGIEVEAFQEADVAAQHVLGIFGAGLVFVLLR